MRCELNETNNTGFVSASITLIKIERNQFLINSPLKTQIFHYILGIYGLTNIMFERNEKP